MNQEAIVELDSGVLSVCFNRPEKKNALTQSMYRAATEAIVRAESDAAVKVVVFTGAGDIFTSGNDINDFLSSDCVELGVAECNLEILLENQALPAFSNIKQSHLCIEGFHNFLDIRSEIID